MSEEIGNLLELVTAGEWGKERGGHEGLDTGVIRSANFTKDHKFNEKEIVTRSIEERKRKKKLLRHGDILIEKSGGSPTQPVGRVLFYDLEGEHTCSNFISLLRPSGRVDARFLYYSLCNLYEEGIVKNYQQQTTGIINLQLNEYLSESIFFPPLPEQKKIAEILSGIDKATMAIQNKIDKITSAHEGLANSWQEKVFLEQEEGTLGDLIASIDSGWSPACEEAPPESGEWGILKVSAVTKGYFCESESKRLPSDLQPREQYLVRKNDLLITRANGNLDLVGRGVIIEQEPSAKLLMSDKILRLKPNNDADRYFLHLLLNSCNVRRQIETAVGGSTGAKNIGQSLLRQICIAIPAPKDQAMIGSLSQSLSATISAAHKRLDYLVSLKKGLSADLLTGRKRVSV